MAAKRKEPARHGPKHWERGLLRQRLQTLRNSCMEGYCGVWDPSGEGREGFLAMAKGLDNVAGMLGLKLKEHRTE